MVTPAEAAQFVAALQIDPSVCPRCRSVRIDTGGYDGYARLMVAAHCGDCGLRWRELYEYVTASHYRDIDDDDCGDDEDPDD